jgi:hypothetical protein
MKITDRNLLIFVLDKYRKKRDSPDGSVKKLLLMNFEGRPAASKLRAHTGVIETMIEMLSIPFMAAYLACKKVPANESGFRRRDVP